MNKTDKIVGDGTLATGSEVLNPGSEKEDTCQLTSLTGLCWAAASQSKELLRVLLHTRAGATACRHPREGLCVSQAAALASPSSSSLDLPDAPVAGGGISGRARVSGTVWWAHALVGTRLLLQPRPPPHDQDFLCKDCPCGASAACFIVSNSETRSQ